jgi:hypothetical protein
VKNRKGIIAFLLIAFGIAWANWEIFFWVIIYLTYHDESLMIKA